MPAYPTYGIASDAWVGAECGTGRADALPEVTTTVDILLDSLAPDGLADLPVIVTRLPSWLENQPERAMATTLHYPVAGRPYPRESWSRCSARQGITIRVNARRIRRAALAVTADGPVRVTVRAMNGRPIAPPILLSPGEPVKTITWRLANHAT